MQDVLGNVLVLQFFRYYFVITSFFVTISLLFRLSRYYLTIIATSF
jgi:hypothetical protein